MSYFVWHCIIRSFKLKLKLILKSGSYYDFIIVHFYYNFFEGRTGPINVGQLFDRGPPPSPPEKPHPPLPKEQLHPPTPTIYVSLWHSGFLFC